MKVLVPVWSPPEDIFAGGYYRTKRLLEHFEDIDPQIIKNDTFRLARPAIATYPTRALYARQGVMFKVMRVINWAWSFIALTVLALRSSVSYEAVYVPTSEILPVTLSGFVVAKMRRVPLILCNLNVRDTEFWRVNRYFHKRADGIITLSEALAKELRDEGITVPIMIGTVGVDDYSVSTAASSQFDAVFVGRHTEAKGIYDLLEIWRRVTERRPGAKLVCLGWCSDAMRLEIHRRVMKAGIEGSITFMGVVPEEKKWEVYANAKVCLFPSHVEGWGIVPIEAQLSGLPVVAYRLDAYTHTIVASPTATLVETGNVDAAARAVLDWLGHDPPLESARLFGRAFSWESAVRMEEDAIQTMVEQANR